MAVDNIFKDWNHDTIYYVQTWLNPTEARILLQQVVYQKFTTRSFTIEQFNNKLQQSNDPQISVLIAFPQKCVAKFLIKVSEQH